MAELTNYFCDLSQLATELSSYCYIRIIHNTFQNICEQLKVRQSRNQIMVSSILQKNEQKITILSISCREDDQDSDFLFCFGRIEDTINCFRDFLTFRTSFFEQDPKFDFGN
jgi:hypothetical protein